MWFIGVEVEQETSAPAPKKNPGSAPTTIENCCRFVFYNIIDSFLRPFTFKFLENR